MWQKCTPLQSHPLFTSGQVRDYWGGPKPIKDLSQIITTPLFFSNNTQTLPPFHTLSIQKINTLDFIFLLENKLDSIHTNIHKYLTLFTLLDKLSDNFIVLVQKNTQQLHVLLQLLSHPSNSLHNAIYSSFFLVKFLLNKKIAIPQIKKGVISTWLMNLSIYQLQNQLSEEHRTPTSEEHILIKKHPADSKEILLKAGFLNIDDILFIIENHHSSFEPDNELGFIAQAIRCSDRFVAQITSRKNRAARKPKDILTQSLLTEKLECEQNFYKDLLTLIPTPFPGAFISVDDIVGWALYPDPTMQFTYCITNQGPQLLPSEALDEMQLSLTNDLNHLFEAIEHAKLYSACPPSFNID